MRLFKNVDFRAITQEHDEKLEEFYMEWSERFRNESDPNGMRIIRRSTCVTLTLNTLSDNGCNFRCSLLPL